MVHQLLLREVENPNTNEMWFLVGKDKIIRFSIQEFCVVTDLQMWFLVGEDKMIRFSIQEFCVVTSLHCSPYPRIDVYIKVEGVRLRDEIFNGNMNLEINDLEVAFLKASCDNDETVVKLALLYFVETILLAKVKTSLIDNEHLLLVDDVEQFKKYP
ncbi:hypothetical protein LWI29_003485 [Acer saccharum]|uniref:DUF1985 domain-containing protein n=1 Tax=Acer saccharum TaxID=4024 RepID=A0AA39VK39_ACESA|nr:hypothetical protein LWI29_003485 [Acer saccharum]